ncbi:DegV family protein [Chloroflexota bacterium]
MAKVGIATDSISCLPDEIIKEYDIRVAPYRLFMDGKDYRDKIDITPEKFWKMFKDLKELPTTGTPSPGDYVEIFSELAKSTDSILCIVISTALSAADKSAEAARDIVLKEHPKLTIEIFDSKNAVGAQGFVVLEAARAAQAGKSLKDVIKVAQDLVPRVKYIAALETLKYLIKGGRAPKTAVIGEFLQVKPIIGIVKDPGLVDSLGKERGKRKAMLKLVEMVSDHADTSRPLHVMVSYTDNLADGFELKEIVTSRYNCAEVYLTDLTPVMTAHTGPAIGLSFYS